MVNEGQETRFAGGEIVVYEASGGGARVEVVVGEDTVWLTQAQMADLFERERSVITKHLRNVFEEGELDREGNVQHLHIASGGDRPTAFYNLDIVISVGYRVKSKRGTQFRRWATTVLRQHLIDGVTINQQRLEQRGHEAERALALALETLRSHNLISDDGQAVLGVVQHYFRSWVILRAYDEDRLSGTPDQTTRPLAELTVEAARHAIRTLADDMLARGELLGLFGQERGDGLESILRQLDQSILGEPAYPTVESRAAHLLYS